MTTRILTFVLAVGLSGAAASGEPQVPVSSLGRELPRVVAMSGQQQAPPSLDDLDAALKAVRASVDQLDAAIAALHAQRQPSTVPPDQAQAALDSGGDVHLQSGQLYGPLVIRTSGTSLYYDGASANVTTKIPALEILPGVNNVSVYDFKGTSNSIQQVILCGHNDASQNTIGLVPKNIKLIRPTVPTYRGKRAIEVNCAVEIDSPTVTDHFNGFGQDAQCIGILNTTGPVWVHGADLSGGTETIMVGGDTVKIPGVIPSDITIEDFKLSHPLAWRTDTTTKHYVKNLFELKTGKNVIVRRGTMDGSWKDAQNGWALMITPRGDGLVQNALFEDVTITNVAGVINVLGLNYVPPPTLAPTSGVVLRRVNATARKDFGTSVSGVFALLSGEVHDFTVEDSTFSGDGNYFLSVEQGNVIDLATGQPRPNGPTAALTITGSTFTIGKYGIRFAGNNNATQPTPPIVTALTITGNTISGPGVNATFKKNLPGNQFPQ